jgi:hypothetical protein
MAETPPSTGEQLRILDSPLLRCPDAHRVPTDAQEILGGELERAKSGDANRTVEVLAADAAPIRASLLASNQRDRCVAYPGRNRGLTPTRRTFRHQATCSHACLLIYGVSGAGKSMLLEKFRGDYAATRPTRSGQRPIVATQMPPLPTLRSLYAEIVCPLGGPTRPGMRFYEREETALGLLRQANPCSLAALVNSALRSQDQVSLQRAARQRYRRRHPRCVVREYVMRYDPQIASRFQPMELPGLERIR